ncbi:hypothetical protein PG994_004100 [Apiospora phragmitis]|uniref:Uncharacterized protein n=1 Tax=Apiospora phragmitis TaxID=2905665 RepID=A0ABR1VPN0_9PEZI
MTGYGGYGMTPTGDSWAVDSFSRGKVLLSQVIVRRQILAQILVSGNHHYQPQQNTATRGVTNLNPVLARIADQ